MADVCLSVESQDSLHSSVEAMREVKADPTATPVRSGRGWPQFFIPVVLIVATVAIYIQVINHDFISLDDGFYVLNNPEVKTGLTRQSIAWAFSTFAGYWHPLTWLSHMADCQIYGLKSGGPHFTNLLLHLANVLLLFIVLKRMTGAVWQSACVTALFAWHPLNVESVAWIAERKGVLSTLFLLLTLLAYEHYTRNTSSWKRYVLVIVALALGLMAKPMLVTLPFALLLLDYWPLKRICWNRAQGADVAGSVFRLIGEKLPLFILVAVQSLLTFLGERDVGNVTSLSESSLSFRFANVLASYFTYVGKMFWPRELAVFYPNRTFIPGWQIATAGVLLMSITALALISIRRCPYLFTGWFWYLGVLLPVIGIVKIGEFSMADRYSYVSLIGLFVMVVWALSDLLTRRRYRKATIFLLMVIVFPTLGLASWFQTGYWQDNLRLYQHTLGITSDNYVINHNLGNELVRRGRLEEGIQHYCEALRIKPRSFETHNSLGLALAQQGRLDEAIHEYEQALRLQPDSVRVYSNLGLAFAQQGTLDAAIASLNRALSLDPSSAEVRLNLGIILIRSNRLGEATAHLSKATELSPQSAEAHNALGFALTSQGKTQEAISEYGTALKLKPGYVTAQDNLEKAQCQNGSPQR